LSRRFVELHGGQLTVDSAPGKGSTFMFTLPKTPSVSTTTGTVDQEQAGTTLAEATH
jgi:signal transduction histidine kinase